MLLGATEFRGSVARKPWCVHSGKLKRTKQRNWITRNWIKTRKKIKRRLGSCNGIEIKHPNDHLVNFINSLPVYQGHQGG
jgi:hypothetical protein